MRLGLALDYVAAPGDDDIRAAVQRASAPGAPAEAAALATIRLFSSLRHPDMAAAELDTAVAFAGGPTTQLAGFGALVDLGAALQHWASLGGTPAVGRVATHALELPLAGGR